MKKKGLLILSAFLLVLCISSAAIVYFNSADAVSKGSKEITIVTAFDGEEHTHSVRTDAEYLADVLLDNGIAEGEINSYGLYIYTVDGRLADEGSREWWCITRGGETVMEGASAIAIKDGDVFELTLMTGW